MVQDLGRVVSNSEVKRGYFLMKIEAPSVAREAKPGQFLTVRCGDATSPLLRRPFGFHRINNSGFQVLYEVVGKGTRLLSELKPGNKVDVLGPLGNGFTVPDKTKNIVIVAGGIGVAPLVALAESLVKKKHKRIYAIIGAKNKKSLLCEKDFKVLGIETLVATDDGSCGRKCFATQILEDLFSAKGSFSPVIFACGPEEMLKKVAAIARERKVKSYASLEENIACGVGACLGCAIETRSGYKLACEDGPVFDLNEVVWK
ncbi:MAG: dihydroorotate dehydrogenase electron transfer subunit [Candidatus Omnitrophota bacterium]|nr:dihydroorotate dehydrogenase electron transfer subunit [Candidatus Omnitrophota bacterium]